MQLARPARYQVASKHRGRWSEKDNPMYYRKLLLQPLLDSTHLLLLDGKDHRNKSADWIHLLCDVVELLLVIIMPTNIL